LIKSRIVLVGFAQAAAQRAGESPLRRRRLASDLQKNSAFALALSSPGQCAFDLVFDLAVDLDLA
jgi:hypothetical protein